MTREEFHAQQRRKAVQEGLTEAEFESSFRTWPCWCGSPFCPGWQTLTWREAEILIASGTNLGHSPGFLELFHPVPDESRSG